MSPRRPAAVAVTPATELAEKLRTILKELSGRYFERHDVLLAMMVCILAKQHMFVLGPPGTAKTDLTRAICDRIFGAEFFDILMDRQLSKEDLWGPLDMALYEESSRAGKGVWQRDVEGFLPTAHIAFLDEIGKSGPSVLNQLLWLLNDRKYRNYKSRLDCPLVSCFGASNELFEGDELAALWDRFLVRLSVDYIVEQGHFLELLSLDENTATVTTVSLEDMQKAINEYVPAVELPERIKEKIAALRVTFREQNIPVSDRRYRTSMRLLRAAAFLNGRSAVDEDDLDILQYVYWEKPEQIVPVRQAVTALMSEAMREATRIEQELQTIQADVRGARGQANDKLVKLAATEKAKLQAHQTKLRELIAKAERERRSSTKLEGVLDYSRMVYVDMLVICLRMDPARAQKHAYADEAKAS